MDVCSNCFKCLTVFIVNDSISHCHTSFSVLDLLLLLTLFLMLKKSLQNSMLILLDSR